MLYDVTDNAFVPARGLPPRRSPVEDHQSATQTVELWIRSFAPTGTGSRRERALERLTALEADGVVDAVEVDIWGQAVERGGLSRRVPRLERIERRLESFEEWAVRTDRRLEPFFRRRRVDSAITGESREVWRLPTIALAEYDEDGLVHVAPCTDGDRTIDVFDRLEALADDGATDPVVRFDGAPGGPSSDRVIATAFRPEPDDRRSRVGRSSSGPN